MAEAAVPVLFVGASASEPIRLAGPPRRLAGRMHLRNPQSASLVLRDAGFADPSGRLHHMAERHAFAPVVLRPAEERAVPLKISIDPSTPPGEYHVELDVMGQMRPAVLDVAETVRLRVEPNRIVLMSELRQPRRMQIVATNEGNVPLSIDLSADIDLRDDVARVRDLRGAIAPLLNDVSRDLDDVIAVLLAVLPAQGPVVGRLSVHTHGGRCELAPGRSAKVGLELTLMEGLPSGGRYRGRVPILTEDLDVIVVSPAAATGEEAPRVAARPQPKDAHRPSEGASRGRKKKGGRR
nr:hypothetical protein Hi04_10k_c5380_00026 [uncultured bacterium]